MGTDLFPRFGSAGREASEVVEPVLKSSTTFQLSLLYRKEDGPPGPSKSLRTAETRRVLDGPGGPSSVNSLRNVGACLQAIRGIQDGGLSLIACKQAPTFDPAPLAPQSSSHAGSSR